MGNWLKQSTSITIKFGPFLDDTDGKTEETGLTISQADIRLSKNGGNIAQSNNAAGAPHDELGYYDVPLDTTDTNTLGTLKVMVHESGALPVWQEFMVVPTNVWDSMFGADALQVDVTQLAGVTQSLTDLKDFADAGYDPATNKVEGVKTADVATTVTNDVGITQAGADKAWSTAARTLTSFGTLIADIWAYATRILTAGTKDTEIDTILSNTNAIKAKTDNLPETPKKNTAFSNPFQFFMEDTNGDGVPSLSVTGVKFLDGVQSTITTSITEVSGPKVGWYEMTPVAGDVNADHVSYQFSGTGAKDAIVEFWTAT